LRATTKEGRQLFLAKKCIPDKILATPMLLWDEICGKVSVRLGWNSEKVKEDDGGDNE